MSIKISAFIKKNIKYLVSILCILLLILMIYPYVKSAFYSVFLTDDFARAIYLKGSENSLFEQIRLGYELLSKNYMQKGGYYTNIIVTAVLSPLNILDMRGLSLVMAFNVLFYYSSIILLIYNIIKMTVNNCKWWMVVSVFIVYLLTEYIQMQESFYWLTGALAYTFPMSCTLCGIACFLTYIRTKKRRIYIVGLCFGVICGGGNLNVPALGCTLVFFILVYMFIKEKKLSRDYLVFLLLWIAFTLVNVLAPGNYIRHEKLDSTGLHPIRAIFGAFMRVYKKRYLNIVKDTDFLVILLLLIICGLLITVNDSLDKKAYIYVSIMALLLPIIVAYPIALGYNSFDPNYSMPRRVAQIVDLSIVLSLGNAAICVGQYIRYLVKNNNNNIKIVIATILVGAFVTCGLDNYNIIENNASIKIYKGLRTGVYKEYNEKVSTLYDSFKNRKGEDVVVSLDEYPEPIEEFMCLDLSTPDSEDISGITEYYELNSISLEKPQ